MYTIVVHKRINQLIALFYIIGLWSGEKRSVCSKFCLKIMHVVACACNILLVSVGALLSNNTAEAIFLAALSIGLFVHLFKMYHFLWKEDEILRFVRSMGSHSITEHTEFKEYSYKINILMKFAFFYNFTIFVAIVAMTFASLPIISNKRSLPLNVYYPFNWKKNEVTYWTAFVSVVCLMTLCFLYTWFYTIFWYIMMCCGIKYETLGNEFRNLGKRTLQSKSKMSVAEKQNIFLEELIGLIKKHQSLQELNPLVNIVQSKLIGIFNRTTEKFKSCFSMLFFIQILTSGVNICVFVYALVYTSSENPVLYVTYVASAMHHVFDVFMVTYFGNEIKFVSSRLSYCLYESKWVDQSYLCRKSLCILMEALKRPEVLVVGKLYPLDLEIFTKILNHTYRMFNILNKLK